MNRAPWKQKKSSLPVVGALLLALSSVAPAAASARPRLGVIVLFDQLRAVELDRYEPFFGDGGFGGLDGARLDAFYAYAGTETGPGHATVATGANPNVHGIAVNLWFEGGKRQYVVDDPAFPVIGASDKAGRSPQKLRANTLGDAMKADSLGRARVVTLSHKDRAAILTGGFAADLAVWYEPAQGRFTSSTAYVDKLPEWLDKKGRELPERTMATATWSPLAIPERLAWLAPPDDRVGEGAAEGLSTTFPHDLKDAPEVLRRKLYRITPQSIDDLFELALDAVDAMKLGSDDEPDLLVVSVSTTDVVGHNYGPESLEQLDTIRRADLALRRFRGALDKRIGKRGYVMAVTADHGSTPVPAAYDGTRLPHGRVAIDDVTAAAEAAAAQALAGTKATKKPRVLGFGPPQMFLDVDDLAPADQRKVIDAVAAAVRAIPGVARVYDPSATTDEDSYARLMRASAFPGRSGQLFVRQEARVVFLDNREGRGTDHGTPYTYDRRVPLLLEGPGVKKGRYRAPVDPRDVSATMAFLLAVPPPDSCEGKPVPAVGD